MPKIFVGEPFNVSLVSGSEEPYASEGYVTIFCRRFFVSQCRNISKRNRFVLCFSKFLVAEKFMDKKEVEVSRFSYENFLSHSAGKIRSEPFCAVFQTISGSKNFGIRRGGEHQDSASSFFCITVPKNFRDEPFSLSLNSGIEKLYASEGYVTIFPLKNFVSQY